MDRCKEKYCFMRWLFDGIDKRLFIGFSKDKKNGRCRWTLRRMGLSEG